MRIRKIISLLSILFLFLCFSSLVTAEEVLDREFLTQVERALDRELDFWTEHNSMGAWARSYIWPDMIPVEGGKKPRTFVSNQDNNGSARMAMQRYLLAYEALGKEKYLEGARRVGDFYIRAQSPEGGWWTTYEEGPDGPRPEGGWGRNSMRFEEACQAHPVYFLAWLFRLTGERKYYDAAVKGGRFIIWGQNKYGGWPQAYRPDAQGHPQRDRLLYKVYSAHSDECHYECSGALILLYHLTKDKDVLPAIRKAGAWLVISQIKEGPTRGWAQCYDENLKPCFARGFEPPAISMRSTKTCMRSLFDMYYITREEKYLRAAEEALKWVKSVQTEEGWNRYYSTETGKPIWASHKKIMQGPGHGYARMSHGWINPEEFEERLAEIKKTGSDRFGRLEFGPPSQEELLTYLKERRPSIEEILREQSPQGFWIGKTKYGQMIDLISSPGRRLLDYLIAARALEGKLKSPYVIYVRRLHLKAHGKRDWYDVPLLSSH